MRFESDDITDIGGVVSSMNIDRRVLEAKGFRGGTGEARRRLKYFIKNNLSSYPA